MARKSKIRFEWDFDRPGMLRLLKGDEEATCGPDYCEIEFQEGGGSDA